MSSGPRWITECAKKGAERASAMRMTTTTPAPTATWSRLNRIQKSCQGVRPSTLLSSLSGTDARGCTSGSAAWIWLTRSVSSRHGRGECMARCWTGQLGVRISRDRRLDLHHRSVSRMRGSTSTPRSCPSEPSAHAPSPKDALPSDVNAPPATHERHRVGRVRLADAGGRVVGEHAHDRPAQVEPREHLAEERPVDRLDHVALVLGAAVVRGDVGPLDMDVQRLVALERLGREVRPRRVRLVCRRAEPRRIEAGRVHRVHPERHRDAALHGHLDEAPPVPAEPIPDRLERGPMIPAVAREDEVARQLAGRAPFGR